MGLSAILRFGKKVCNLAPELILGTGSETMGAAMKKAKGSIFMKADAGVKALAKDVAKKQATEGRFIKRLGKNIVSTPKDLYNGSKLAAKAAKAAGQKSIEMIAQKQLLPLTGYVHGGCSPVGMKKPFPTFIDETALLYDKFCISAGKVGVNLSLAPQDVAAYLDAQFVDLLKG